MEPSPPAGDTDQPTFDKEARDEPRHYGGADRAKAAPRPAHSRYVERAPTELDADFDWRRALPGQVRMPLVPWYWVDHPQGLSHQSAPRYFSGFVEHLLARLTGQAESMPDMRPVLERAENLVRGTREASVQTLLVALYALWHYLPVPAEYRRPAADRFLADHERFLLTPSVPAYVVGLLTNRMPPWSADEWEALATRRHEERQRRAQLVIPAGIDALLQAITAQQLLLAGRLTEARWFARLAVEELPGEQMLSTWRAALDNGEHIGLDPSALLGVKVTSDDPAN